MKADPVRARALDILDAVEAGRGLDALLGRGQDALSESRDRAFLAELVRGTLQWRTRYDHVIVAFARKRPPRDPRLVNLLRLTLHQLLTLDGVPAYAAVHQAGELCRRRISPKLVGFVNGLLQGVRRSVLGQWDPAGPGAEPDPRPGRLRELFAPLENDPAAWLAAWHSQPRWLIERWLARFGREATERICAYNNESVPLAFRVLEPQQPDAAREFLTQVGCPARPGEDPRTLIADERPGRAELTHILEQRGDLIVQDPAVQEATAWLGAHLKDPQAHHGGGTPGRLLDLCAAPGGKTVHLAAALGEEWSTAAMDRTPGRMRLLNETLTRTAAGAVGAVLGDGLRPPFAPASLDAVLLDGPCSGTGVLRHHPDGRWRVQPEDLERNGATLRSLALQAADLLAPGGWLLYATCSLEPEENDAVLDDVLNVRPDLAEAGESARRAWLPGRDGGDGFFAACLRRGS